MTETCPECRDTHCDCQRVAALEAKIQQLRETLENIQALIDPHGNCNDIIKMIDDALQENK